VRAADRPVLRGHDHRFLVFNHDFSSLIMSGLFALSLGSYLAGIFLASRRVTTDRQR